MTQEKINQKCPVCRSEDNCYFAETMGYRYHRCEKCDTLFQIYQGDIIYQDTQRRYISEIRYEKKRDVKIEFIHTYRHLHNLVTKFTDNASPRVLDVGGGAGHFADYLQQNGIGDVSSIDPHIHITNRDEMPFAHHSVSLEEWADTSPAPYDVITYNHVIEHIQYPVQTVGRSLALLKEGGIIILATPNNASFNSKYKLTLSRLGLTSKPYKVLDAPKHVVLFNKKSMRIMAETLNAGLVALGTWTRPRGWISLGGRVQDILGIGAHLFVILTNKTRPCHII